MVARLALALAAAIAFGAAPSAALARPAPAQWPQAASDLPADPAVRFGVLPNGMRYAVMRNATPAGQTSLRLRIGSGSLEETDAEQGLAHVLEHMSFKGSTHVPAGEELKILERKGLAFGPDTNAQTGFTQTLYMLDLPTSGSDMIDTGLMLLRETASELTIAPDALEPERGVVLSEERLRDTPGYRAQKAQIDLLAHGQRITERFPIGLVDVVAHAPASLVREFYEANYRPERATLVAVGDFDPDAMAAKIKARFSDWRDKGPPTAEPELGAPEKRGLTVKVVALPGASTQTLIAWARPYDDSRDTAAKRRRDTVEALALAVLNRRLEQLAQGKNPPFLRGAAAFENLIHSDKVALVETVTAPDAWRTALSAADAEVRRLLAFGVEPSELSREITEYHTLLATAAAGADTRRTPDLATALATSVDESEVFTSPAEDLRLYDADTKDLTVAEVNAAARAIFAGAGPLVEVASPQPVEGGEASVRAAFQSAEAAQVTAPVAEAAVAWPYVAFGAPGRVVSRNEVSDLAFTSVRFANGVSLTIKPTTFRKDEILVAVTIPGGRAGLGKTASAPVWAASAFVDGGLGKITLEDMQRAFASRIASVNLGVTDEAFALTGETRPADLLTELQMLTAYVSDAAYRPEAFERVRTAYLAALPQLQATPGGVLSRDFASLIRDRDPRWAFPSKAAIEAARPEDLRAMLSGPLAHAPLEVTIVGDVDAAATIAAVAQTLGALPARAAAGPLATVALEPRFPAPTARPLALADTGRPDQAIAVIAWPGSGFLPDLQRARAAYLAGDVLQNRVVDRIRIAEGATYSPETQVSFSEDFPDFGYAFTAVETPPGKIAGFFTDVGSIVADIAAHGVTADELERARNPHVSGIRKAQMTNEYWRARLAGSTFEPRRLDLIRTSISGYGELSAADVQAAAARWFDPAKAFELTIEAAPSAP